jgi:hypothetical protein
LLKSIALELGHQPIHDALVEVVAAQVCVAVGGLHFELARAVHVVQLEDGDVVRAAAQVEHGDLLVGLLVLVEAVGEGRRGGLIDDAEHVEAGDLAGVLGGLALCIVEVGRDGNDGLRDAMAEVVFGGLLHLLQDHRRDLGRRVALATHFDRGHVVRAGDDFVGYPRLLGLGFRGALAHEALDREDRILRVGDGLALGDLAHQALAVFREADDRRGCATALGVWNHHGIATFQHGHHRVGGSEVDADNFFSH